MSQKNSSEDMFRGYDSKTIRCQMYHKFFNCCQSHFFEHNKPKQNKKCDTCPLIMGHTTIKFHFVGLNAQLFCQSENSVLGRSHIWSTNIYVINLIVLLKERIQESEAAQDAPQHKHRSRKNYSILISTATICIRNHRHKKSQCLHSVTHMCNLV